jgi:hypothetical protein
VLRALVLIVFVFDVFVAALFAPVLFVLLFFSVVLFALLLLSVARVGILSLLYLSDARKAFISRIISSFHIHVGVTSSAIVPRGQRPAICNRLREYCLLRCGLRPSFLAQHPAVKTFARP